MTISANYPTVAPSLDLDFANAKQLDSRISYSRSTTGTYYDGVTSAVAEQNLVGYSNGFTTGWSANVCTVANTGLITDPLGGTNGITLTQGSTGTGGSGVQGGPAFAITGNQTCTYSVYAKYNATGAQQYISISAYDGTTGGQSSQVCFDILNGTITRIGAPNQWSSNLANIVSAPNGWWRCSVTFTPFANQTNTYLFLAMSDTATPNAYSYGYPQFVPNGTSYFYAFGAQVEVHSSAGLYVATTGTTVTNYIPQLLTAPVNQPRFDANPTTGASLGLLMEQQSTNLLTYSADFSVSAWAKGAGNPTVSLATNIAPDGTLTANKLIEGTSSGRQVIGNPLIPSANTYTSSIYAKAAERTIIGITHASGATVGNIPDTYYGQVNLTTGAVTQATSGATTTTTATPVGNGWYRISVVGTTTANSSVYIAVSNGSTFNYTGNGTSGLYIWGGQLELLAFPTSYIPTVGSQVTRAQDFATITGTNFSSWFNNNQGTVYCSFDNGNSNTASGNFGIWSIDNSSSQGYFTWRQTGAIYTSINGTNSSTGLTLTAGLIYQNSFSYNNASGISATAVTNGVTGTSLSAATQLSYLPSQMQLGRYPGSSASTGHIRKFAYYPIATTSAQLQALTGS